jgi:general secretion pathway protein D
MLIAHAPAAELDSVARVLSELNVSQTPGEVEIMNAARARSAATKSSPTDVLTPPPLITRTLHFDPNILRTRLARAMNVPTWPAGTPAVLGPMLRNFLTEAGADFASNNPANAGKSIAFDDRNGLLIARTSAAEMDLIQNALDKLIQAPPQYNLKFKLVEIDEPASGTRGFDWLFADSGIRCLTNAPATNTSLGKFIWRGTNQNRTPVSEPLPVATNALGAFITGTLDGAQFRAVITKLEQRPGVDVLTAPEITTESGRQARCEVGEVMTVVLGTNATPVGNPTAAEAFRTQSMMLGPSVDVIPTAAAQGDKIDLDIDASILEFLGYDNPRKVAGRKVSPPNGTTATVVPLPHFRLREMKTRMEIGLGQTIVLGGMAPDETVIMKSKVPVLGDIPMLGSLFRNTSSQTTRRNLLVFVTVNRINPDGSLYVPPVDGKR